MTPAVPDLRGRVDAEIAPGGAAVQRVRPRQLICGLPGEVRPIVLCHTPDVGEVSTPLGAVSGDPGRSGRDVQQPGRKVGRRVAQPTRMEELDQPVIFVVYGARGTQDTREVTDIVQGPPPLFS